MTVNGSLRRHIGGKRAARTRKINNMIAMYGQPDNISEHELTFIAGQPQYYAAPSPLCAEPKFGSGKYACPNCLDKMSWGMKEEHNAILCRNRQTTPASTLTPASSEPSTIIDGSTSPTITPTITGHDPVSIRFPNVRTRQYEKHKKLIKYYCRSRKVKTYEKKEGQLSPGKLDITFLGKVPFTGNPQRKLTPATQTQTLGGTSGSKIATSWQPKKQQSKAQGKIESKESPRPQSDTSATSTATPSRPLA